MDRSLKIFAIISFALASSQVTKSIGRELDPFYTFEQSQVSGQRGEIVNHLEASYGGPGSAYRVLYRTLGGDGAPTVASAIVVLPKVVATRSLSELKTVVFLHSTTGIAPKCAPSAMKEIGQDFRRIVGLEAFLEDGHVVVAPDLVGLGARLQGASSDSVHPYLQAEPAGISVIDAIKAAQALPSIVTVNVTERVATPGNTVALFGHSQGGFAALAALSTITSDANASLRVAAAAISAPPVRLDRLVPLQRTEEGLVLSAYIAVAYERHNMALSLGDLFSQEFAARAPKIARFCLGESGMAEQLSGFEALDFGDTDGRHLKTPALPENWKAALLRNRPALLSRDSLRLPFPVLVSQGGSDPLVPPRATRGDLLAPLCALVAHQGTVAYFPLAGHNHQFTISSGMHVEFIRQHLKGQTTYTPLQPRLPDAQDWFALEAFSLLFGCSALP